MDSDLKRRGGRPTKPATPGNKKIKLSLVVPAETKALLDAAREAGRSQAEEAVRLIGLGRKFEEHGRFLLPVELQQLAIEQLAAHANGPAAVQAYLVNQVPEEQRPLIAQMLAMGALELVARYPLSAHHPEDTTKPAATVEPPAEDAA
jgi:hypothetical protein